MKKTLMILAALGFLFTAGPAIAADVVVITTIPDEYVDELTAMVQDKYMHPGNYSCTGLTEKECFQKMCIKEPVIREYRQWKEAKDVKTATDDAKAAVVDIEVNVE